MIRLSLRPRPLFHPPHSHSLPSLRLPISSSLPIHSSHHTLWFSSSSSFLDQQIVKVPQMAESISEGTLKKWIRRPGQVVKLDEEVATIETDKIDVSVNAPVDGKVLKILAEEEDTVSVGQDLFVIEVGQFSHQDDQQQQDSSDKTLSEHQSQSDLKSQTKTQSETDSSSPSSTTSASTSSSSSSSSADRKRRSDVDIAVKENQPSRPEPQLKPSKLPQARSDFNQSHQSDPISSSTSSFSGSGLHDRTERRVKMNRMRLRISERLKQSQNTAASLTTFNEIDMSALMKMRSNYKDGILKERGIKLGFMSVFAKACTLALQEIPAANASIEQDHDGAGQSIVYHDYVDLSVAVATPKGLVTPVVRNVEKLSVLEIENEIAKLGSKARDGKISLEDMAGGTFTISNGGVFGSLFGTPIINLPQSAVLGMHTIKETPVVRDGQIVIRPIMIVALTYDHRLLDGREAVTFLVKVKQYVEDPCKMLLA